MPCRVPYTGLFVLVFLGMIDSVCHRSTVWLGSSVVRVLARSARGPGFESRSGHVSFTPVTFGGSVWVCARAASSKGLSRRFLHGFEQIRGRI